MHDRRRLAVAAAGLCACVGLAGTSIKMPAPLLVWNASASAPIGLYRTQPAELVRVGDLVIARLPAWAATLAAHRHYLPLGVPLVKRVVAVAGSRICARGDAIFVGGKMLVRRLGRDRSGRRLPTWTGCRTLRAGEVFLAMANVKESFDGRYFGRTLRGDIIAQVEPVWVR